MRKLDRLFSSLYEDKVMERITERNFEMMSGKYQKEQLEIEARLKEVKEHLPPDRKNWNRTVRKRLMKLCFFMEKAVVLQSIRWIRAESILISLWVLNQLKN